MLLLQWRYVNQCSLEITLTVTWVRPLGSGLTYKHRQIADYPQDFQSNAVFFFFSFKKNKQTFMTFLLLLDIAYSRK